ncbi:MAG: AcvB/VirJ family lysyl-phosphatidylglycerol hydrolase [Syntrophales bacterium]
MKLRIIVIMAMVSLCCLEADALSEETLRFGRFGTVTIYKTAPHPSRVVLFVSGDGGWNKGVVGMARELATMDALVVGIDITHYLRELSSSREHCSYPAADFEALSKYVQQKFAFPNYVQPLLVGYSSGATLVYATLVQSPPNTFSGAVSMGFCPDLPLQKPFCRGYGLEWNPGPKGKGYSFLPAKHLPSPWTAFQGKIDQVCDASQVEKYVKQVAAGKIVLLPKVGHGFSVPRNWLPQFRETVRYIFENRSAGPSPVPDNLKDLPLVEVKSITKGKAVFAVIISGDGGWAGIDREVAQALSEEGVSVVGLNALQYFWKPRTPEGTAHDLERIIRHYLDSWNMKRVILSGYSLGADVLPFLIGRMPDELRKTIGLVALISPSRTAEFEFHFTDWIGGAPQGEEHPLLPEVNKLAGMKILCFYGAEEKGTLCTDSALKDVKIVPLAGGHHFGGDYRGIAETILKETQ